MRLTIASILFFISINAFSQSHSNIVLIFNNVYPDGGDLYALEDVVADDSIRTNIPGLKFVSFRCSVILPGFTWESVNYYKLSSVTKDKIRQVSTSGSKGSAGIAKVYLARITFANSAGDTIILPERTLRIRRVSTYVEPVINDTILIFDNEIPILAEGNFIYYRSDLMSEDTIRTNIPGLKVVSFTSTVSCYPNFKDPNTCFLNPAVRSLLKQCRKGFMKVSDLTLENRAGERFVMPYQEIQYMEY